MHNYNTRHKINGVTSNHNFEMLKKELTYAGSFFLLIRKLPINLKDE